MLKIITNAIPLKSSFHSAAISFSRYPALKTRITRFAHLQNQRKIAALQAKLGDKYRLIGRDKRQSPYSERASPSKPTQPEKAKPRRKHVGRFLASSLNPTPFDFIPGMLRARTQKERETKKKSENIENSSKLGASINMPSASSFTKDKIETDSNTILKLKDAVPPLTSLNSKHGFELKTQAKPFNQFGMGPSEAQFLFEKVPIACRDMYQNAKDNSEQQAEMLRRIVSLENANSAAIRKFNTARVIEMLQTHPMDTGSPQVQAATMFIKIQAMREHLGIHKKDKSSKRQLQTWESKQKKMLQYLRRKDLKTCVNTCLFLGIDPKSI